MGSYTKPPELKEILEHLKRIEEKLEGNTCSCPPKKDPNQLALPIKIARTPYNYAMTQIGVEEIIGVVHNPKIQAYLKTVNLEGYSDETAWCAAFVNWCCVQAGVTGSGKPNARSFLTVGMEVTTPKKGDIVVFWRVSKDSWKGHVGFFSHFDGDSVVCLGGNQSNRVCLAHYPKERVLSFRRI
jgi:uncharacterized protein (TIGR02594 family)